MPHDARLDEFAFLFLGLAQGIDGRLHFKELSRIEAHLERWRHASDRRDVTEVLDEAIRDFKPVRVIEAIETLGQLLSDPEKRQVLEQLSLVALADRHFLKAEAEYIGRVAYEWQTHPTAEDQGAFWSVLRARNIKSAREAATDVATLYLAAAIEPDGELTPEEMDTITTRVAQWLPDLPTGPVDELVREALAAYSTPLDGGRLSALVTQIRSVLPDQQVSALVRDLRAIAQADGAYTVESRGWIDRIEGMLG